MSRRIKKKGSIGSAFDEFLKDERTYEATQAVAIKRVLAWRIKKAVKITRRGKTVLAILPWELYESIIETLDILGDRNKVAAIRSGVNDSKRGRVVANSKAKKRLGV